MISNPLTYILIRPNVINSDGLNELSNFINSKDGKDLCIFDAEKSNLTKTVEFKVNKEVRDTQIIDYDHNQFNNIKFLMENLVKKIINPFYSIEVTESEVPQILSYDVGGHYKPHNDAEAIWKTPCGKTIWKKCADRDLSIIIFLNDNFEGGDLVFPELKIRIKPEPGMLVCFPSNHHYVHSVESVTKGKRYSIVTWAKIKGFISKEDQDRELSEKYNTKVI